MNSLRTTLHSSAVVLAMASLVYGQEKTSSSALVSYQKPAWLTDLSLSVKETYDNNVFMVSGKAAPEQDSWITTVSPKLGFNFAPLLGDGKVLQALALGYAPEIATFHGVDSEDYTAHRFANTLKGKSDAFSFTLENAFNYVDGSKESPIYAGADSARSAFATGAPRERREQIQDRAKVVLQYDLDKWFVRPTASFLYYDLMTDVRTTAGYQNYADRYDVNGGADFGYRFTPKVAATLGYRYGHQYQQQYSSAIDPAGLSSPNDYQRVLVGVEGKPLKWLTVAAQVGPDFRSYEPDSAGHRTPVGDHDPVKYYGEASASADLSANDTLAFKYKQWQWVASTGKLPYFDSLYELSYRHKFSKQLALDLGFRMQESDYTSANVASGLRDDWQYSPSIGVTYTFNSNLSVNAAYSVDLGRNVQEDIANAAYREYDRHLASLSLQFKL